MDPFLQQMEELDALARSGSELTGVKPSLDLLGINAEVGALRGKPQAQPLSGDAFLNQLQQLDQRAQGPTAPTAPQAQGGQQVDPDMGAAEQFLNGAVNRLADYIGVAGNALMPTLAQTGLALATGQTNSVAEGLKTAAEQLGLDPRMPDTLMKETGEETITGLAFLAALVATRGQLLRLGAVPAGAGIGQRMARFLPRLLGKAGEAAAKRPFTALAMEPLAAGGAVVGAHVGGFPGAVAGGILGAKSGESLANTFRRTGQAVKGFFTPRAAEPELFRQGADPLATRDVGEDFVKRETGIIERRIQDILDKNQPTRPKYHHSTLKVLRDSQELQQQLFNDLQAAEQAADNLVTRAWKSVAPRTHRVPLVDLKQKLVNMIGEMGRNFDPADVPLRHAETIVNLGDNARWGQLVAIRSRILKEARLGRSLSDTNIRYSKTYVANLYRMAQAIDRHLMAVLPDTAQLKAAKAVSQKYHQLFTNSPLGEALADARTGGKKLNPQEVFDLLAKERGIGIPIRKIDAWLKAEAPKHAPELQQTFEDAIRTRWREMAGGVTPGMDEHAVEQFINRIAPGARRTLPVYGELKAHTRALSTLLAQRADLEKSAVAKYVWRGGAGGELVEPERAIKAVWGASDAVEQTRQLMQAMRGDPEALAGFRNLNIQEFWRRAAQPADLVAMRGATPVRRMADELEKGVAGRILREVLDPDQYKALKEYTDLAARIEAGDTKSIRTVTGSLFKLGMRIFGASVGRYTGQITGGGTIQHSGIMANTFREIAERTIGELPPQELLARAVLYPEYRRALRTRVPHDDKTARAAVRALRYLIGVEQGSLIEMDNRMTAGEEDEREFE